MNEVKQADNYSDREGQTKWKVKINNQVQGINKGLTFNALCLSIGNTSLEASSSAKTNRSYLKHNVFICTFRILFHLT